MATLQYQQQMKASPRVVLCMLWCDTWLTVEKTESQVLADAHVQGICISKIQICLERHMLGSITSVTDGTKAYG